MKRIKFALLGLAAMLPAATVFTAAAGPQNLLTNGDFSNGTAGWTGNDGNPHPFFGGVAVINNYSGIGNSYYGAVQCVKVSPNVEYAAAAQAIVPSGAPAFGKAQLRLQFFATENCTETVIANRAATGGDTPATQGVELNLKVTLKAPANAKSVAVKLQATKEPKLPAKSAPGELTVAFDDVSLTKLLTIAPAPKIPDLPLKNPDPDPDPQPEPEDPAPEPQPEPENPQPQPEPQDEPVEPQGQDDGQESQEDALEGDDGNAGAEEDSTGTGQDAGDTDSADADSLTAPSQEPLPPATGDGEKRVANYGWAVIAGCLAAIAAGGAMVMFAVRRRERA